MNIGDKVIVYPEGRREIKARAIVAVVSANQRSIAVGFDERPEFRWMDELSMMLHPQFGIMLLAARDEATGPWTELLSQQRFEIEVEA